MRWFDSQLRDQFLRFRSRRGSYTPDVRGTGPIPKNASVVQLDERHVSTVRVMQVRVLSEAPSIDSRIYFV